jgi:hypothetical protein
MLVRQSSHSASSGGQKHTPLGRIFDMAAQREKGAKLKVMDLLASIILSQA